MSKFLSTNWQHAWGRLQVSLLELFALVTLFEHGTRARSIIRICYQKTYYKAVITSAQVLQHVSYVQLAGVHSPQTKLCIMILVSTPGSKEHKNPNQNKLSIRN